MKAVILKVVKSDNGCTGCYYENDNSMCLNLCNIKDQGKIYKPDEEGEKWNLEYIQHNIPINQQQQSPTVSEGIPGHRQ